jgi:hypothetical protein
VRLVAKSGTKVSGDTCPRQRQARITLKHIPTTTPVRQSSIHSKLSGVHMSNMSDLHSVTALHGELSFFWYITPVIRGYFRRLTSRAPPISHLELKAQLADEKEQQL